MNGLLGLRNSIAAAGSSPVRYGELDKNHADCNLSNVCFAPRSVPVARNMDGSRLMLSTPRRGPWYDGMYHASDAISYVLSHRKLPRNHWIQELTQLSIRAHLISSDTRPPMRWT